MYPELKTAKKLGSEKFTFDDDELDFNVNSFWAWSSSELLGNRLRGILAEYIIHECVGVSHNMREEWDAFDVITPEGIKIEVKSSSYIQSWNQQNLSPIKFDIGKKRADNTEKYSGDKEYNRRSDVYVFCVYAHKEKSSANPLNLNHWEFYVLTTSTINEFCIDKKSISLNPLIKLNAKKANYKNLYEVIKKCKA